METVTNKKLVTNLLMLLLVLLLRMVMSSKTCMKKVMIMCTSMKTVFVSGLYTIRIKYRSVTDNVFLSTNRTKTDIV